MNIIRIHHRSRNRILITDVLSMFVIGLFAFGIAFLDQFQGLTLWMAIVLFVANMAFFGWNIWNIVRQNRDFVCLLTSERFVCQSPDESLARSFDIPIDEIEKLAETDQSDGRPVLSIHTHAGQSVTLTYNFGNPALSFFKELRKMVPSTSVHKS